MKKILWLCNTTFRDNKNIYSGSWLQPLAQELQASGSVQIYNISIGNVIKPTQQDYLEIRQWIIPKRKADHYGQGACKQTCEEVFCLVNQIKPDLVHIWGTESIWASIYAQGYIKTKTIIDIQGLLYACADYYYGGLTFTEIIKSIHLKEIIMPWRTLFRKKRIFKKRGEAEICYLKKFAHISVQSDWVRRQISILNPNATYYDTKIMLRDSFYSADTWKFRKTNEPVIFSSCAASVSYKGMHLLIKTIAVLKNKYPNIQLKLAGNINVGNKLIDGYSIFLQKQIEKYDLTNNVTYLGRLNEFELIEQLQNCHVCVVPSFVETYCLAFAEAMMVGTPTVVSYAGAMPELAQHGKEALFYNSADYRLAASYVDTLLTNKELSEKLSYNGRQKRLHENNKANVLQTQLNIYNKMLGV